MANRDFKDVQALDREVKCIAGSFSIHATDGTTTLTSGSTGVTSVSTFGSDTGVCTITLDDKYSKFLGAQITYEDAAHDAAKIPVGFVASQTVTTTKTVVLRFVNANDGGLSANAELGGDTVYFMIWVKNSSVT